MQPLSIYPGGRRAAVSLTYDDGPNEHLDHALSDLGEIGLRGTFYIPTGPASPTLHARTAEWRAAVARGHEIGNHTRYHPCGSVEHRWVKPQFALEAYDLARIERELRDAADDLSQIIGRSMLTSYAYTCWQDWVGPRRTSYRHVVAGLFPAARGGPERVVADPRICDWSRLPAWSVESDVALADISAFLDDAVRTGGWAVLVLHGVDGGHPINISRSMHRDICRLIHGRRDDIACDSFINIALHARESLRRAAPATV
jgi:peptidoglycan-N-acetylglucosamine deacetylase